MLPSTVTFTLYWLITYTHPISIVLWNSIFPFCCATRLSTPRSGNPFAVWACSLDHFLFTSCWCLVERLLKAICLQNSCLCSSRFILRKNSCIKAEVFKAWPILPHPAGSYNLSVLSQLIFVQVIMSAKQGITSLVWGESSMNRGHLKGQALFCSK